MINDPEQLHLFSKLRTVISDDIQIIQATKATLVHISHALEDIVLNHNIPALIFTGFQESSYWNQETERYRGLSKVANQICIFAGKPLPESSAANQLHIELDKGDPLLQEWFLAIISDEFSVVLCGQDIGIPAKEEATRVFDTIWTFDIDTINLLLNTLEQSVAQYRPDKLPVLQQARETYTLKPPDPHLLNKLLTNLLNFEEQLNLRLLEQERQWAHIIQALSHVVYVIDMPEGLRYISPKIKNLTGYEVNDFISDNNLWVSLISEDDQDIIQNKLESTKTSGAVSNEYRITNKQGQLRWVRDSVSIQHDPVNGKLTHYGVIEDITDQKLAEEAEREHERLRLQFDQEHEMNDLKNRFMYTVSHEFRTPLATILSSGEILERYNDKLSDERRIYHIATIKDQALHLRALLDDINAVMSTDSTTREVSPAPIVIGKFVKSVLQVIFDNEDVTQTLNYTEKITQLTITIDPHILRQIINNLVGNAIKYSPQARNIDVSLQSENGTVMLLVRDYGIGIPEEDKKHLFEPFHRGSNVEAIGGTGMGLAIVADCVKAHRGEIDCVSNPDEGTTFYVKLSEITP